MGENDSAIADGVMPLERVEAELCTLAGHLAAASARFIALIADFDQREGWGQWGVKSCAHWLAWKCGLSPGAAREHVRVARSLSVLPVMRAEFGAGRLSYSKIRALTRVATPDSDGALTELALLATAAQVERITRGYRRATAPDDPPDHDRFFVRLDHDDDGSVRLRGRLPAEVGALVEAALAASCDALKPAQDVPAGTPRPTPVEGLAAMAETVLAVGPTPASGPARHQVVVHVDAATLTALNDSDNGRSELENGTALDPAIARRIACDAALVAMLRGPDGNVLDVGRATRSIPAAIRRALRVRDRGCRFPGCTQVRWVDAHHIRHWAHGGPTALSNLVVLCRAHHRAVHDHGFSITVEGSGRFTFHRPDGARLPDSPELLGDADAITRCHPAAVDADTILRGAGGESLDLPHAVWTLVACSAS